MALTIEYIPIHQVTAPIDGYTVWVGRWWAFKKSEGVAFICTGKSKAAVCNSDATLLRRLIDSDERLHGLDVVYVPVSYEPHNCSGWPHE